MSALPDARFRGIPSALAGAAVALLAGTALALAGGASVEASLDANDFRTLHYAVALAFLGAGAVVAWRLGLRVAATATALLGLAGVYLKAPTGYKPVMALNAGLTVLAVLGGHLAAAEYALRNPAAAKRAASTRAAKRGLVVGVAHAALVFWLHAWLGFSTAYFYTLGNVAIYAWIAAGAVVVGTAVGVCWLRYRLVLPGVLVAGLLAWSVYETLPYLETLRGGSSSLAGTLFTVYEAGWYGVLIAALAVGGVEYVLRRRLRANSGPATSE